MPDWATLVLVGVLLGMFVPVLVALAVGAFIKVGSVVARADRAMALSAAASSRRRVVPATDLTEWALDSERERVLVVDDDAGLRLLLRTTLPASEFDVEEAESAEAAAETARFFRPEVVILDVGLPGKDGVHYCRELKRSARSPHVILLTGGELDGDVQQSSGADAVLRKPFSPVELLKLVDKVSHVAAPSPPGASTGENEQLLIYARDLSRVVEVERGQRRLLQHAYRQTVTALADALEAKDRSTGLHGRRVQRYGLELAAAYDESLVADPSLEYGFLLHDVGKIGIPETILRKPGPLDDTERRLMQRHPLLGVDILDGIPLLEGAGLEVVRSHHERWDGRGYPDGLAGEEIPVAARIFALADALDAITTDRPYRKRLSWETAIDEILVNSNAQFDPGVVAAFALREGRLRQISADLTERAA
jgi:response regulator RpfG family c-di-GMP phosphodiesterase